MTCHAFSSFVEEVSVLPVLGFSRRESIIKRRIDWQRQKRKACDIKFLSMWEESKEMLACFDVIFYFITFSLIILHTQEIIGCERASASRAKQNWGIARRLSHISFKAADLMCINFPDWNISLICCSSKLIQGKFIGDMHKLLNWNNIFSRRDVLFSLYSLLEV